MYTYYQVKVRYTKEFRDGTLKRVTEPYLVMAASHADAEERIHKEVGEGVRGEFKVVSITPYKVEDIFIYDDAETLYKVVGSLTVTDSDSGKEKLIKTNFLVEADSVVEAVKRVHENLNNLKHLCEITSAALTNFVEIFPLTTKSEEA